MIPAFRTTARMFAIGRAFARRDALSALLQPPFSNLPFAQAARSVLSRLFGPRDPAERALRPGQKLARALADLGPSFIKLGQALSTRTDLLGEEICADLSALQDRLPPFAFETARAIVERELGQPLATLFTSFDETPVAAASIAQVHFATVRDTDGSARPVAVKILRPDAERRLRDDMELFRWIADTIHRLLPQVRRLRLPEAVETFAESIMMEMDLRFEAAAAAELRENFIDEPSFHVPLVDWRRTARRVMTLERIIGKSIADPAALEAAGVDPDALLEAASTAFFHQVFRDGFFHADMHPGNVFILPDGVIAPVDFGIMGRLDLKTRRYLAEMLVGFLTADYRRVAEVHFRAGYVPARKNMDNFTQAIRSIGEPLLGLPLAEISVARLLAQLFQITEMFEMETQPQLLLLQKTMMQAESLGRILNPHANIWALAQPLVERWVIENLGPQARVKQAAVETAQSFERLPALMLEAEKAARSLSEEGLRLHPDTAAAIGAGRKPRLLVPLWAWAALIAFLLGLAL